MTRALAFAAVLLAVGCGSDAPTVANSSHGSSGGTGADAGPESGAGGSSGSGTGGGWPGGAGGSAGAGAGGAAGAAQGGTGGAGTGGTGTGGAGGAAGASSGGSGGCPAAPPYQCTSGGPCEFPQGVPDPDFIAAACTYQDTDPSVDAAVNAVMASLTGCGVGSDCPITGFTGTTTDEICQSWFAAVTAALRAQGYCAGQHAVGSTDEIAVSNSCCAGKWYGYHICNYGGPKVVWNPGARRGWWMIDPSYCP